MAVTFRIRPIGVVRKRSGSLTIEVYPEFSDALLGIEQFSHILVNYWFHKNDTPEKRAILRVHPRKDKSNPLTGVFATRSPIRPNLIASTVCELQSVEGNHLYIHEIDAYDKSPVIDIKPYVPANFPEKDVRLPNWVKKEV
jgi:tRNA-Thr(GGU) m(6)t(6)A37 methyltransferase TsaA